MAQDAGRRHRMEALLVARCWKDPAFKGEFLGDPKGTIEKYSGRNLSEALRVFVHEEDAHTMHITLPAPPEKLAELSDEDLDRVVGGSSSQQQWPYAPSLP